MGFFINHSIFVNTSENSPLTQVFFYLFVEKKDKKIEWFKNDDKSESKQNKKKLKKKKKQKKKKRKSKKKK